MKVATLLAVMTAILVILAGCTPAGTLDKTPAEISSSQTPTHTPVSGITNSPEVLNTENLSLRIGSLPRVYDIIPYVAQQEGIFQKYNLTVEIISFRSEVEKDTVMITGDLDGVIEGTFGAVNLNKDVETSKIVGHSFMPYMFNVIASKSSGITDPVMLEGKEVATSVGTIMEYALDNLLTAAGVDSTKVILSNVTNMSLRLEMLNQGKLTAGIFTSPLSDQAVLSGNILLLDDTNQMQGGPGLIFSMKALENKSENIDRFVRAWQEAVRTINADPDKYRSLLISTAKVPDAVASSMEMPVFPELRLPSQDEVDKITDWMKKKGILTQDILYSKIVETKFLGN